MLVQPVWLAVARFPCDLRKAAEHEGRRRCASPNVRGRASAVVKVSPRGA